MREEVLLYWLSKEGHIAKLRYDILKEKYGDLQTAFGEIRQGRFQKEKGFGEGCYKRLKELADYSKLESELEEMKEKGISFVTYFSGEYPKRLKNIYSPPLCLYYRGKLPDDETKMVAIVGSRAASERGLYHASKFARELSMNGVGVISGMALGIDSAAHIGCMEGGSRTFAVLGCGVDICYPKSNFEVYMRLMREGGILSEFAPKTEPIKTNFPQRNRIISGLSDGILVVEAREKSGSLITADLGLNQGKNIYAIPGEIDHPLNNGTNKLIQVGAKLVLSVKDILEDFDFQYKGSYEKVGREVELKGMEKLIYSILSVEPRHISSITEETGISGAELFGMLLNLEMKGYVKRVGFEYFVCVG